MMTMATLNGVALYHELHGSGDPLALVHGSWGSHDEWEPVVSRLAQAFRVLVYDRRGHSRSERPDGQGSVREDVADLAGLLEATGFDRTWVVGNSFGASIALRLAAARPELVRGVIAHEPPLFLLLAHDPAYAAMLEETGRRISDVVGRIAAGDHAGAAELFVETVALGPGMWAQLDEATQGVLIENAPTFLDETRDPEQLAMDAETMSRITQPVLVTTGGQSPPLFGPVVERLVAALPRAAFQSFSDAGHLPHAMVPEAWCDSIVAFAGAQDG